MRGPYSVSFTKTTIAAASGDYDLFEIDPAAEKPVEIIGLYLGQKTELGDAAEEQVRWSIVRLNGTLTSGSGTAATPRPLDPNDGAASFGAETIGATPATGTGTTETLHEDTYNIRAGLPFIFPPDMRPKANGNQLIVVRLLEALADDADMTGTLYVKEL